MSGADWVDAGLGIALFAIAALAYVASAGLAGYCLLVVLVFSPVGDPAGNGLARIIFVALYAGFAALALVFQAFARATQSRTVKA